MIPTYRFLLRVTIALMTAVVFIISGTALFADETDRCHGISLQQASAILGISPDDIHVSCQEIMISPEDIEKKIYRNPPYSCSFRSASNFLKSIHYNVYIFSSGMLAETEFNTLKTNFNTVAKTDPIQGAGDTAFRVEDKRFQRTVGLKKKVLVDVLSPKEGDLQKQVLALVLEKL